MKYSVLTFFFVTCSLLLSAQGDFTWAIYDNYTAQHDNYIFDLASDGSTNLISVGRSSKSSGSDNHLVVYKHDSDGAEVWQKTFTYSQYLMDAQVITDASDNIIITASFRGDFTLGNHTYTATNSQEDIALFKLDEDGEVLWSVHDGRTAGQERAYALTQDADGHIYYGAYHQAFKTYIGNDSLTGGGQTFIASYESDGTFRWVKQCSKGLADMAALGTDIYVFGHTGSGYNYFGDSAVIPLADAYIARFSQSGVLNAYQEEDEVVPKGLMVDDNRVYTTGFFTSTAVVADSSLTPNNTVDSYIGYYDRDLQSEKAYQVDVSDYSNGFKLVQSSAGNYALMGNHNGTVRFAGDSITGSGFSHNVYVLEFDENDAEVAIYGVVGEAASTATEVEEAGLAAGSNNDFYINGYLKGKGVFGTQDVDPGGNKYHAWLAQIGEAGQVTSTDESIEPGVQFTVYPNPFQHQLNVALSQNATGRIDLYDASGRIVLQQRVDGSITVMQVGHLQPGSYFLHVTLSDGSHHSEQVLVF